MSEYKAREINIYGKFGAVLVWNYFNFIPCACVLYVLIIIKN